MYNPNNMPQPDWRDDRSRIRKGNPHLPNRERDPDRVPDEVEVRINRAASSGRILILLLHFAIASLLCGGLIGLVTIIWTGDAIMPLAMVAGLVGGVTWVSTMALVGYRNR